jgi:hypothetical protein
MEETLSGMWGWIQENPEAFIAIVVYVIANFAPRPHPEKMTGWQKSFWQMIDRLCVLTHHLVPKPKMILLDSPSPTERKRDDNEAPEPEDEPSDDGEEEDSEEVASADESEDNDAATDEEEKKDG